MDEQVYMIGNYIARRADPATGNVAEVVDATGVHERIPCASLGGAVFVARAWAEAAAELDGEEGGGSVG